MTLSFVDPGVPSLPVEQGDPSNGWAPYAHDLAYLLYEAVVTLRRSLGRMGAETRKALFTMAILRAALESVSSGDDKHRLLDEIQASSLSYLQMLDLSYTPRGAWRALLRVIARRRISAIIGTLRAELVGVGVSQ